MGPGRPGQRAVPTPAAARPANTASARHFHMVSGLVARPPALQHGTPGSAIRGNGWRSRARPVKIPAPSATLPGMRAVGPQLVPPGRSTAPCCSRRCSACSPPVRRTVTGCPGTGATPIPARAARGGRNAHRCALSLWWSRNRTPSIAAAWSPTRTAGRNRGAGRRRNSSQGRSGQATGPAAGRPGVLPALGTRGRPRRDLRRR